MTYRLLDLFSGAGCAARGYAAAGFEVTGVDVKQQRHYPFEHYVADAMTFPLDGYDVVHASPPCQRFTRGAHLAKGRQLTERPDLLTPTLARLREWGGLYVVENVEGAPMPASLLLCGSSFGLAVRRHRLFTSPLLLLGQDCRHQQQGTPVGVYHQLADHVPNGGTTALTLEAGHLAMGLDPGTMTWDELKEGIPPAYTAWIGEQLVDYLDALTPRVQGRRVVDAAPAGGIL